VQCLVDDGEVLIVVDESGIGVDLRVDANPELHIVLKLCGTRHGSVRAERRRGGEPHEHTSGED
jgi:hypothetical protein